VGVFNCLLLNEFRNPNLVGNLNFYIVLGKKKKFILERS
jgi:hypothetical protein